MSEALCVQVPGKLMLLGEYVVLEGAPALVAAVDRRVEVRCRPQGAWQLLALGPGWPPLSLLVDAGGQGQLHPSTGLAVAGAAAPVVEAFRELVDWCRAEQRRLSPQHLHVDSRALQLRAPGQGAQEAGRKLGLGSSAAVVVGLLAALAAAHGLLPVGDLSWAQRQQLFCRAEAAHRRAQGGHGSGADVAAAVYGGLLAYRRPRQAPPQQAVVRPLSGPPPVAWLAAYSGQPASTPALLARTEALREAQPARYWQLLERLGIFAQAGCEFWGLGDGRAFVTAVDGFHTALGQVGEAAGAPIVTPQHAQAAALVRRMGGAYKVSGAGGGDLGLAFCASGRPRRRLERALSAAGMAPLPLGLCPGGVQIAASRAMSA